MFALWRAGRRATWWNLAAICIALAAAMNVKFSGPVFFAIAFIALSIRAVMPQSWPVLRWELKTLLSRAMMPVAVCFVAGVLAYVSIWACYGFRYAPTKDPNVHFDFDTILTRCKTNLWQKQFDGKDLPKIKTTEELDAELNKIPTPATANVIQWMEKHKLLPEAWLDGFFFTYATTRMRGSFLNGQYFDQRLVVLLPRRRHLQDADGGAVRQHSGLDCAAVRLGEARAAPVGYFFGTRAGARGCANCFVAARI